MCTFHLRGTDIVSWSGRVTGCSFPVPQREVTHPSSILLLFQLEKQLCLYPFFFKIVSCWPCFLFPQYRCLYLHQPYKTLQTLSVWEGKQFLFNNILFSSVNHYTGFLKFCLDLICGVCVCACANLVCMGRETFRAWLSGEGHPDQRQDLNHRRYPHWWQAWHSG